MNTIPPEKVNWIGKLKTLGASEVAAYIHPHRTAFPKTIGTAASRKKIFQQVFFWRFSEDFKLTLLWNPPIGYLCNMQLYLRYLLHIILSRLRLYILSKYSTLQYSTVKKQVLQSRLLHIRFILPFLFLNLLKLSMFDIWIPKIFPKNIKIGLDVTFYRL